MVFTLRHRHHAGGRQKKDRSLALFVCPPAFVHFTIVICVSRDCMKTTQDNYTTYTFLSALNSLKRFNLKELILRKDSPDIMNIIQHFSRRRLCILVGKKENLGGAFCGETKA